VKLLYFVLIIFSLSQVSFASSLVEEGYWIPDAQKQYIVYFKNLGELTIDHVDSQGYEVYGPKGLANWLKLAKIPFLPMITYDKMYDDYPSPEQINDDLIQIHQKYPKITKLFNLGKSFNGRDLLVLKISDNPEIDEHEPEFKYVSSMHGNEITGRELMMKLIEDMLESYNQADPRIVDIVNNTEIFIMPQMNPDGSAKKQRANGRGYDLNRDFPDFTTADNQNVFGSRNPETIAMMKFQNEHNFSLSANFHGGAQVVNYPWDTKSGAFPLNSLVVNLSLDYAKNVTYISNSREFSQGITNGFAWYEVDGGMQDWSYYWYDDLQFTIELSDTKWPEYNQINYYYQENKEALLSFMEKAHQGLGLILSNSQTEGTVKVWREVSGQWEDLGEYGIRHGEFYKILEAGNYKIKIVNSNIEFQRQVEKNRIYANGNYEIIQ